MKSREELEQIAKGLRRDVFRMALNSGTKGAHIGGSMSAMEILAVLYGDILQYHADDPMWDGRDRFVMSKAHSAIGLYAALKYAGFLADGEIETALHGEAYLYKHPRYDVMRGMEFAGGSLGQGISQAVGGALALRMRGNTEAKYYVLVGDGECDEGSVWEAAAAIIHYDLRNLTVVVDRNRLQNDGPTEKILDIGNMGERWHSAGFSTIEVDGHDVMELREAFLENTEKPKAIIANTVKGKGCSFAENVVDWHISYFTKEMYEQAMEELDK